MDAATGIWAHRYGSGGPRPGSPIQSARVSAVSFSDEEIDRRIKVIQEDDLASVLRDTAARLNNLADRLERRVEEAEVHNDSGTGT